MSDTTIADLFQSAKDDDVLSQTSLDILGDIDIGQDIQDGMGANINDIDAMETVLVGILVDDSVSIRMAGNTQVVRDGVNMVINALGGSVNKDAILVYIRYLNGKILCPFRQISSAPSLDSSNYNPNNGTPLYDSSVPFLGTVLAKSQEFSDASVFSRTISLIISDGADTTSTESDASSINPIVTDMLRQENHIIAAMGIDDGGYTDFEKVFGDMGIPDEWILTPGNSEKEIRAAFNVFSQASQSAAQGGTSFSTTSDAGLGGFGN